MRLLTLLLPLCLACGINPQPSPPSLDLGSVMEGSRQATSLRVPGATLFAPPGSVMPAVGVVVVTRLDDDDLPAVEPIAPDGSFRIFTPALTSEEIRVQVRQSVGDPVVPFDLQVTATGIAPAPRPLADCLRAEPPFELGSEPADLVRTEVRLVNDCRDEVRLRTSLRVDDAAFAIDAAPDVIPAGSSASVELTVLRPTEGVIAEDVLLIAIDEPARDLRAISLLSQR